MLPTLWIALWVLLSWCARSQEVSEGTSEKEEGAAHSNPPKYGLDVSWPMHHSSAVSDSAVLKRHHNLLQECFQADGETLCQRHEEDRLSMNRNQPPQMTNFTTAGYAKVPIPPKAWSLLSQLWLDKHDALQRESWSRGSIYTNHRNAPIDVLNVHQHLTAEQVRSVEFQVQQVLQDWAGVPLVPTSTYGIRVYGKGSLLQPHVDRLPLVLSAILHIAHDENDNPNDEWPLQVIGHDGLAQNLTLQPGQMVLYESHSIIHGRPFPFKGHFYANVFVHFEPIGYSYELEQSLKQRNQPEKKDGESSTLQGLLDALLKNQDKLPKQSELMPAPATDDVHLPPYPLTEEEQKRWRQDYQFIRTIIAKDSSSTKPKRTPGATSAHTAAATGQLALFRELVETDTSLLDKADGNGWKPIHEAARGGHVRLLEYLIEQGVDVNERTNQGDGASPLWWALQYFPDTHPAVQLLKKHGARSLAPKGQ